VFLIAKKKGLKGIGGWLSFFIFLFAFLGLINLILGILDIIGTYIFLKDSGVSLSLIHTLSFLGIIFYLLVTSFIIYVIFSFNLLKQNAVQLGTKYFSLIFYLNIIYHIGTKSPLPLHQTNIEYDVSLLLLILFAYIPLLIWSIYIYYSKRIEHTFPKKYRTTELIDTMLYWGIIIISILISFLLFHIRNTYSITF